MEPTERRLPDPGNTDPGHAWADAGPSALARVYEGGMTPSRLISRPMLASMFVVGGFNAIRNADKLAVKARAKPVTDRLVPLLAGRAESRRTRSPWSASTAPSSWSPGGAGHRPGAAPLGDGAGRHRAPDDRGRAPVLAGAGPDGPRQQRIHFFKNVSMLGGLMIAAADTEGKPGVAWRTRRPRGRRREARRRDGQARASRQARTDLTPSIPEPWPAPPATGPVDAVVSLPGSKSLTNRALLLAALADGPSVVRRALRSRDTLLMAAALTGLGADRRHRAARTGRSPRARSTGTRPSTAGWPAR